MSGVTAKEIAAYLGLSPSAVSLALNGKPGVSEQTRRDIFEAAAKLGYTSVKARAYATPPRRICFVFYVSKLVSVAENTTFSGFVLQGVESAATALGYSTQVRYLRASEPIERQTAEICRDADGIIFLGTDATKDTLPSLEPFFAAAAAMPVVVVDCPSLSGRFDCVVNDNYNGVRRAVAYMVERGCRRFAYLRSRHRIENFAEREAGLRSALKDAGLELALALDCGISFDEAILDAERCFSGSDELPDAIFAENDIVASAAIRALRSKGVALPEQVSVIGFDDIPVCELTDPTLTTVHSYKEQLGETAMTLLHYRFESREKAGASFPSGRLKVSVSTELRIRGSVK